MQQRTLILILYCGIIVYFQPLFASKKSANLRYNENEDFAPISKGPVKRSVRFASPISVIDNGPEVTITFYQTYTNCIILVYKNGALIFFSAYDTIPLKYTETYTLDGSGSYEIDILSERKTVYNTELNIKGF